MTTEDALPVGFLPPKEKANRRAVGLSIVTAFRRRQV
jgi:hypothetical protein